MAYQYLYHVQNNMLDLCKALYELRHHHPTAFNDVLLFDVVDYLRTTYGWICAWPSVHLVGAAMRPLTQPSARTLSTLARALIPPVPLARALTTPGVLTELLTETRGLLDESLLRKGFSIYVKRASELKCAVIFTAVFRFYNVV